MYKSFWDLVEVDEGSEYQLTVYHLGKTPVLRWYGIEEKQDHCNLYFYSSHKIEYSGTVHASIFDIFKCIVNQWGMKFIKKVPKRA